MHAVRKDFPVGRELKRRIGVSLQTFRCPAASERTFPLEGNWNWSIRCILFRICFNCPKGLSRWKGIETFLHLLITFALWLVRKDFPVGRELKLNCFCNLFGIQHGPKGLSRWKGMETHLNGCRVNSIGVRVSERTFPLEGNWNILIQGFGWHHWSSVRKDFPVGRELKHTFPRQYWNKMYFLVRKDFPVGRELKPSNRPPRSIPFVERLSPKGLSRWKGIETRFQ